ncbi:ABC transporter permease subunit [Rossellomorea aquimaris]|uniref:ABC transporter permease subunit n=1 Tax=Rossellomorea aquimaris TaxID=189382 RepID=UPI001CD72DDB|nr:ABC transporter permease subunit [Rossellomorea aquimaris]MCA1055951.1 ABC transporter permease subunit [Rossellomorea aquimaris]
MIIRHLRLWIPVSFLLILIVGSFILPSTHPHLFEQGPSYLKDEETGKLIAAPPYTPSEMEPMGSDKLGRNVFYVLIAGAKFTLLSAVAIALLRMSGGFLFGLIYTYLPGWVRQVFKGLSDTFNFIPLAIIAFVLLTPLQKAFEAGSLYSMKFLFIQIIVISIIVIPSLGMYIGEEMRQFLKHDFITVSKQIGADRFFIIKRHLRPQFSRHAIVMFSEQLSQTLYLLIQLGILHICLGGLKIAEFGIMEHRPEYFSFIDDWAATMSINIYQIHLYPWLLLSPLVFFAISIFCVNEITTVLKEVFLEGESLKKPRKNMVMQKTSPVPNEKLFTLTGRRKDGHHETF